MPGVVVGVGGAGRSGPVVRWASAEAQVRGLSLTLVHAWDEPVDVTVELTAQSLPDVWGRATSCAEHGPTALVLQAHHPELLVLGSHAGAPRLSHVTRVCLDHTTCPVVVVPDSQRSTTRRVVVGVSGSPASRNALQWAGGEAQLRGARLVVVHVWQVHPASAWDVLHPARAFVHQQRAALDRPQRWVSAVLGAVDAEVHAIRGAPLDVMLDLSVDADLLVLGRGEHSGIGRFLHSAPGDDLTGLTSCPVAVIPGPRTTAGALV